MNLNEKNGLSVQSAQESCRRLVENEDHDRYVMALFAPADRQPALFALHACNHEIAKTRESVSDPMIGEIRLQWWHEAIEGLVQGEGREHPVVTALGAVPGLGRIAPLLYRLIEARRSDLDAIGLSDFAALEAYTASVGGALNEAAAMLLGAEPESDAALAARAAGDAWAMTGLLRAMIFEMQAAKAASTRLLPGAELDAALDRSVNSINPDMAHALMPIITRMLATAEARIADARAMGRKVKADERAPILLATLAARHVRAFRKAGEGLFALPGERAIGPATLLRLLAAKISARF